MSTPAPSSSTQPSREEMVKHLEFIQAIIARHAANSFQLKAWSVTLVAALFALAAKDANARFAWVAMVPVAMFWGLDAYYLLQEKRFRDLYNWVRLGMPDATLQERQEAGPFSLRPSIVPTPRRSHRSTWIGALLSLTLLPFYLVLGACVVGAARLAPPQELGARSHVPSKAKSLRASPP